MVKVTNQQQHKTWSHEDLEHVKKVWLAGNQIEGLQLFEDTFLDFPNKPPEKIDIDFFCDVYITHIGLLSSFQRADRALSLADKVSPYVSLIHSPSLKIRYFNNIAASYRCKGNFLEMLNYVEKAMELSEAPDQQELHQLLLSKLGSIYISLGDYESARNIFKNCLKYYRQEEYTWRIGTIFRLLGVLSLHEGDLGLAKSHLLIALDEFLKVNDLLEIAETYAFLARSANVAGDQTEARMYAEHGIQILGKDADTPILGYCLTEFGRSFINDDEKLLLGKGIPSLHTALNLCKKHGHNYNNKVIYQCLALAHEKIGDFKNAYHFEKAFNEIDRTQRNGRAFAKIRHTEKAVAARANQLEIENERLLNSKLEATNARLQSTLDDNELFMRILSHDLKNPLGSMYSVANMLYESETPEAITKEIGWIYKESKRLHGFIEQLTRTCRFENSWNPATSAFNLNDPIAQTLNELSATAAQKEVSFDFEYSPLKQLTISSDLMGIREIIRNIFLTSINYTLPSNSIRCQTNLMEEEKKVELLVQFTGSQTKDIDRLFNKTPRKDEPYLQAGSILFSLGLTLSKRIATRLSCTFEYNQTENTETFSLAIPTHE